MMMITTVNAHVKPTSTYNPHPMFYRDEFETSLPPTCNSRYRFQDNIRRTFLCCRKFSTASWRSVLFILKTTSMATKTKASANAKPGSVY